MVLNHLLVFKNTLAFFSVKFLIKVGKELVLRQGQKVVIVEDLVSTGKSSLKAVEAVRNAGCEVVGMVALFSYGFPVAEENFENAGVKLITLSNYNAILEAALETHYISESDIETLHNWRKDPAAWQPER